LVRHNFDTSSLGRATFQAIVIKEKLTADHNFDAKSPLKSHCRGACYVKSKFYKWVQPVIVNTKRTTVLPALHYGRSRIVEAKIDQTLFVVRKLNANDVAWLRENDPQTLAEKAKQLGEELSLLATAVGPQTVSIEEVEAA